MLTLLFVMNVVKLAEFDTVDACVVNYVKFKMAIELPTMFYSALADSAIKKVFQFPVQRKNRGREIDFMQRTSFHKCARVLYKVFRSIYVAIMFYMSPFLVYAIIYLYGDTRSTYEKLKKLPL